MKATHTPGPLTITGPSGGIRHGRFQVDDGGDYAIIDSAGKIIGEAIRLVAECDERPAQANACLWAAAPDLLAACKAIEIQFGGMADSDIESEARAAIDLTRSAIAKAEGGKP